ncbi:MAG: GNAT family N-acetyltransferase [Mycobacteriales bacterium]
MGEVVIRAMGAEEPDDAGDVAAVLMGSWGSTLVVGRGVARDASRLPGFLAERNGVVVGLLTYDVRGGELEVVTVDALERGGGTGTLLVEAAVARARELGLRRVWLITTNDNLDALRFYQRRGFRLAALYPNAIEAARRIKPAIPEVGAYGIPIRDELELEYPL